MKFYVFALLACASAIKLVKEPSDEPAKLASPVAEEKAVEPTQAEMDTRIANSLKGRKEENKAAIQQAWNDEDTFASEDRKH